MKLTHNQSKPVWASFRYEKLPLFCYCCGRIGHGDKDCDGKFCEGGGRNLDNPQYGPWMRVNGPSNLKKRSNQRDQERHESDETNNQSKEEDEEKKFFKSCAQGDLVHMAGMLDTHMRAMPQSPMPTVHMLAAYNPLRLLDASQVSPRAVLEGIQPTWLVCFLKCLAYVFLAHVCALWLLKHLLECPMLISLPIGVSATVAYAHSPAHCVSTIVLLRGMSCPNFPISPGPLLRVSFEEVRSMGSGKLVRNPEHSGCFKVAGHWKIEHKDFFSDWDLDVLLPTRVPQKMNYPNWSSGMLLLIRRRSFKPMLSIIFSLPSHRGITDGGCSTGLFVSSLVGLCLAEETTPWTMPLRPLYVLSCLLGVWVWGCVLSV
ncbi:hypothetical protein U1Q18_007033 [Sarracenia purpurea var. burkii]